ncbi:MAG: O-antigen ligase domain-containing protein [Actinobacteria bacterium]|nr:O-antigen ligase domain-containing protein [Actinomycetota bacterium]
MTVVLPARRDARRADLLRRPAPPRTPTLVWAAIFLNVLAFSGMPTLVPIPGSLGQLVTQGSLVVALVLVLLVNPGMVVRPNLVLVLLSMLAVVALVVSLHNEYLLGSTFRACRLIAFTCVLWLLTPWWGRSDLPLLRWHLTCLRVIVGSVLVGAVLAPGAAFSFEGRLSGALWPIPPTQVGHYAAVLLGCTVVLWFGGVVSGRTLAVTAVAAGGALVLCHTRTALLAVGVGLTLAGASMFLGHARVRRASALVGVLAVVGATAFAPWLLDWFWRGQSAQDAAQLTGRTKVWTAVFAMDRPRLEELFGSGLSNKSFQGLPIDSHWVATYLDQGWFGVFVSLAFLLVLLLLAFTHPRGVRRAVALFLIGYCAVASVSETGLGDASPYLLDLFVAASLLAVPSGRTQS